MTVPYRYIKGAAAGRDETCVRCGSRRTDLVVDHCHVHGYARGLLCGSCNARLAVLDAGTAAPTPNEAFYLGNCPECRKAESLDSPHAFALRIGAVALAVASALGLSPRQAATLALALAEDEGRETPERKAPGREPESERREHLSLEALAGESLTAAVRELRKAGRTENEIKAIVPTLPGHEGVKPDSLKKAIARTR